MKRVVCREEGHLTIGRASEDYLLGTCLQRRMCVHKINRSRRRLEGMGGLVTSPTTQINVAGDPGTGLHRPTGLPTVRPVQAGATTHLQFIAKHVCALLRSFLPLIVVVAVRIPQRCERQSFQPQFHLNLLYSIASRGIRTELGRPHYIRHVVELAKEHLSELLIFPTLHFTNKFLT